MASTASHLNCQAVALAAVITLVSLASASLGGLAVLEHDFQPEGGLFGLPTRVNVCGEWFRRDAGDPQILTTSEVEARRAEVEATLGSSQPLVVLEPTIGQLPLLAEFGSGVPCGSLVAYLHVGPNRYVEYAERP